MVNLLLAICEECNEVSHLKQLECAGVCKFDFDATAVLPLEWQAHSLPGRPYPFISNDFPARARRNAIEEVAASKSAECKCKMLRTLNLNANLSKCPEPFVANLA